MENVLNSEPEAKNNPENRAKATKVLQLNPNHPLFESIKTVTDKEEIKKISEVFYDEAMLLEGFEIEDKQNFITNLNSLMLKAYKK